MIRTKSNELKRNREKRILKTTVETETTVEKKIEETKLETTQDIDWEHIPAIRLCTISEILYVIQKVKLKISEKEENQEQDQEYWGFLDRLTRYSVRLADIIDSAAKAGFYRGSDALATIYEDIDAMTLQMATMQVDIEKADLPILSEDS